VPQHLAISTSISNDLAAELVLISILWLAVKRAQDAVNDKYFVMLGGILFGAALLTKTTTYIPGAILLLTAEIAQRRNTLDAPRRTSFVLRVPSNVLIAFAVGVLIAAPMFLRGALTYGITDPLGIARHDAVVLGQPTTAEMIARHGLPRIAFDFFAVTFKSFWAQFGWMGVLVNDRIYVALAMLCALALLGFAFYTLRFLRQRNRLTPTQRTSFGLLLLLCVVAFADYVAYNFKFLQFQGRYLFPALISIAFILVVGLRELIAREYQHIVFALLYGSMVVLDLMCLFWFIIPQLRIAN